MAKILENQVAIVFGGTGSVGSAICEKLSSQGAKVIVHYNRSKETANKIVNEAKKNTGVARSLQADAADGEAVKFLLEETIGYFGRIDIIVNTIHKSSGHPTLVRDMKWEDWFVHLEGLKAHFNICKNVLPYMIKQNYGRIVFISGGLSYRLLKGCSAYTAIKVGLNGFSKTLALEEGEHNITVNVVAPGRVVSKTGETSTENVEAWAKLEQDQFNRTPLKRSATAEDVANAVLYFASPGSSCVTGQTLFVAGGEVMPMP